MATTRRPLQPLSPLSPNIAGARYSYSPRKGTNGLSTMEHHVQDGSQDPDDVSLASLENATTDSFDRLLIQNARDERILHDALRGRVQPFSKARTRPNVGVTLENLERHNKRTGAVESPPSSSGSVRSDPAIQPPISWGRKAKVKRNWMRTIKSDDEETEGGQDDTIDRLGSQETPRRSDSVDVPRPSVEDSPLSHKSSLVGTPAALRQHRIEDWDFDLNEASLIASTPYLPRNTALDDIRQREIESLREQGVTKNRLDKIRESSPEQVRRPRSASAISTTSQTNDVAGSKQAFEKNGSPEQRMRKRTNSWQKIGKSQAVVSEDVEFLPIVIHRKSSETIGIVDRGLHANAQSNSLRPAHRREDSQDLLRRLARVSSSTPSPGRATTMRPQTAPANQLGSSLQTMDTDDSPTSPKVGDRTSTAEPIPREASVDEVGPTLEFQSQRKQISKEAPGSTAPSSQKPSTEDVDATPMPVENLLLDPKTPVVTGAWVDTMIDTPRSATVLRPKGRSPSPSESPEKGSPDRIFHKKQLKPPTEQTSILVPSKTIRPSLPRSAVEAVVEEARSHDHRHPEDFGDSTINSLEDLITPRADNLGLGDPDDDTLQGLQLPTATPRNEAERRRQQELLHLHRMNERLRAARTSIRDASRGIKRVENRVERVEETVIDGETVKVVYRECPCAVDGQGHQCKEWTAWRPYQTLFYDERLKTTRKYLTGWGLTALSILLLTFLVWWVLENTACEIWCHHEYANSYEGYGVRWNAPKYPYVIPTVFYRNFVKPWWTPLWAVAVWVWRTLLKSTFGVNDVNEKALGVKVATIFAQHTASMVWEEDVRMGADEFVR